MFFTRLKRSLSRRTNGRYKKEELAELLANNTWESKRTAYSFLSILDDHDVLIETGKEPTVSGPKLVVNVNCSTLMEELKDSEWYQELRDLFRFLLGQFRRLLTHSHRFLR